MRKGEERDLQQVLGLIKEFAQFQRTPEKVSVTLDQMKAEKDLFSCFVAEDCAGRIVGFVSFFFCYYSWSGRAIYMDDLYVEPASRGQGIGTKLLTAVRDYGKMQNCYKFRWQVSRWNENAIGFYKSLGAEIDEVEINCNIIYGNQ
jgi:diamine N-acetyltransferase